MKSPHEEIEEREQYQTDLFTDEVNDALADILESCLFREDLTLNLNNTNATTTLSSRVTQGGELFLVKLPNLLEKRREKLHTENTPHRRACHRQRRHDTPRRA